jgi:hypothetical protein
MPSLPTEITDCFRRIKFSVLFEDKAVPGILVGIDPMMRLRVRFGMEY